MLHRLLIFNFIRATAIFLFVLFGEKHKSTKLSSILSVAYLINDISFKVYILIFLKIKILVIFHYIL